MKQKDVVGCGGGIDLKCTGGCLQIYKVLYSCQEKEANKEQMKKVKAVCEKKESCTVQASRTLFGNEECPDSEDSKMNMWITYGCNDGKDETKVTGPQTCILDQCQIESLSFALDTSGSMMDSTSKDIWQPKMIKLVEEMANRPSLSFQLRK